MIHDEVPHPHDEDCLKRVSTSDLAPGESKARAFDPGTLDVRVVRSADDPLFDVGYDALWRQFGPVAEVETKDVLRARLAWDPSKPTNGGIRLLYEMIVVRDRAGTFVAVRDHTAIVPVDADESPLVVVHLSHVLIEPSHRGSGLVGWMRAWPLGTARAGAVDAGLGADVPIDLVAEMEHPDPARSASRMARLASYEKAGFKKVDPAAVDFWQPDFRDVKAIDADRVRPIPMGLIVRRVGRERETGMSVAETGRVVDALYGMYAEGFRRQDMRPVLEHRKHMIKTTGPVRLGSPTA
jgi:hypothetical protein